MARVVEIKRDLKKTQEAVAQAESQQKTFADKVASLIKKLCPMLVERANLQEDLDKMPAQVQRKKDGVGKSLSNVSTEVWETFENMVQGVKLIIQADFVAGRKKMETKFHMEPAC